MYRVALEEHFVMGKPEHLERWLSTATIVPKDVVEKLTPILTDTGARRIDAMDEGGVDHAVLSNVGSVQGRLDAAAAMRLAREANDHLARIVQDHPERFSGFVTTPLQDPAQGADELERGIRELGLKGTMLFGQTNGLYLDDDRFSPFWERAEALETPIYLHAADPEVLPRSYVGCERLQGPVWSWTAETSTHTLRLVINGVFERYPKLKLVLGHMGEVLPYMFWRLDRRMEAFATGNNEPLPSQALKRCLWVTTAGVFSDEPFSCAIAALGEDHVMFAVDYPFESMSAAGQWLQQNSTSPSVKEKVSFRNAAKLFSL